MRVDASLRRPYTPFGAARKLWQCRDDEILVEGPAGTGKALSMSSIVMTTEGPTRMRDVKHGQLVCGPDGKAHRVIGVFPQGIQDVYEIEFSIGEKVRCTLDHLWEVKERHEGNDYKHVYSTSAIIARMNRSRSRRPDCLFQVPITQPVEFRHVPVPVNPYVLGVLIGDGSLRRGAEFTSADLEVVERVQARIGSDYVVRKWPSSKFAFNICHRSGQRGRSRDGKRGYVSRCATIGEAWMSRVRVPGGKQKYIGSFPTKELALNAVSAYRGRAYYKRETADRLVDHLKSFGLIGKRSPEKFIPQQYMVNTSQVRWELVRGLMDTDGTVDRKTGQPSFCTSSSKLAIQFRWLIESLGGLCRICKKKTSCLDAYICHVRISHPEKLFSLVRKKEICQRKKSVTRYIRSVKKVGREECQCIRIDSQDGLFLTDRFVVTHNSRAVLEKINLMMMKYPGARGLICRKTRESMTQSVLVTFEDQVLPIKSPLLEGGGQRRLRQEYVYPNGSRLIVGGLDDSAKIMSTEYDVIGIFEGIETTEEDLERLTTRLGRNNKIPYQQIIVDVNPGPPSHWLNKRAKAKKMTRLLSRHRDNPILFDQVKKEFTELGTKYLKKLDRLSGVRRMRLLEGKWAASEGMVYDAWDEEKHIIDFMPEGWSAWRKVRSIDFGFNNPFVCLWGAIDPDGDVYIYREMYFSHRIVAQHAIGVKDADDLLVRPGIVQLSIGEIIEATVADHDREDRATLEANGVDSQPAYKDQETGIEAVKDRLREQLHGDGTKRPRIYFFRDMLVERDEDLIDEGLPFSTTQEFDGYHYEKPKEGKAPKEIPVDKDNHGMDALRYLIAYVDELAGTMVSVEADTPSVPDPSTWKRW